MGIGIIVVHINSRKHESTYSSVTGSKLAGVHANSHSYGPILVRLELSGSWCRDTSSTVSLSGSSIVRTIDPVSVTVQLVSGPVDTITDGTLFAVESNH